VGLEQVSWFAPAKWGFAALASTDDLNDVSKLGNPQLDTDPKDSPLGTLGRNLGLDVAVGFLLGVAALALTAVLLRRIEPKVGGRPAGAPRMPRRGRHAGPGSPRR
jgi:hypothetical protein